ncbi:MAG: DUF4115 domain-containing protein [Desulfuromonadales bacterium]|nr:DUF4115 domain-containing protein [Desulfuromonadales bacterium]
MSEIDTNRVDPSASSPGAILKRCREYHDLSLEEAEEATKIGANYLKALEEDQVGQFANPAYLKGFLRIYATYLGLNPDDMIRLYDKLEASSNGRAGHKNSAADTVGQAPRKKFPLQKLAMPAVLLVLILITSAIVNRSPAPPVRQNPPIPAPLSTPVSVVQQKHSSARPVQTTKKTDEVVVEQAQGDASPAKTGAQKALTEHSRGVIIRLKVTQGGTLSVAIDGSASQAYDLGVGDSIEWKADRTITLELSNAGGVEAELNGRQLKPFGPSGTPASIILDSEGVRQ